MKEDLNGSIKNEEAFNKVYEQMKHILQTMKSMLSDLEPLDSLHIDGDPQARPLHGHSQGPVLAKPEPVINLLLSRQLTVPVH